MNTETVTISGHTYDLRPMNERQRAFFVGLAESGLVPTAAGIEEINAVNWESIFALMIEPYQKNDNDTPPIDKDRSTIISRSAESAVSRAQERKKRGIAALAEYNAKRKQLVTIKKDVETMIYSEHPCVNRETRAADIAKLLAEYAKRSPNPGETSREYLEYLKFEKDERKRLAWIKELAPRYAARPQQPEESNMQYAMYLRKCKSEANRAAKQQG